MVYNQILSIGTMPGSLNSARKIRVFNAIDN